VRVRTDGQTDRRTDANRFYTLSDGICYSYWAHENSRGDFNEVSRMSQQVLCDNSVVCGLALGACCSRNRRLTFRHGRSQNLLLGVHLV